MLNKAGFTIAESSAIASGSERMAPKCRLAGQAGQVLAEYIVVLTVLFLLFEFSLSIYSGENNSLIHIKENLAANGIAKKIALAIDKIFLAGNGAATIVRVQSERDYNISIAGGKVEVWWENTFVDEPLLAGDVAAGNYSSGGSIRIRNNNGAVIVEKA